MEVWLFLIDSERFCCMLQETSDEFDPHLPPILHRMMSPWMVYFYEKNVNKHVKSILCIVSPTVQTKNPRGRKDISADKNSWGPGGCLFDWGSKLGWFEIWRSRYHVSHQVRIQLPGGYEPWGWMVVDTWVDLCAFWWLCLRFCSLTLVKFFASAKTEGMWHGGVGRDGDSGNQNAGTFGPNLFPDFQFSVDASDASMILSIRNSVILLTVQKSC